MDGLGKTLQIILILIIFSVKLTILKGFFGSFYGRAGWKLSPARPEGFAGRSQPAPSPSPCIELFLL